MTTRQIKKDIASITGRIASLELMIKVAHFERDFIQKTCPHKQIKSWTNNDGDGQFVVERCLVCGLQRDGGLPKQTTEDVI